MLGDDVVSRGILIHHCHNIQCLYEARRQYYRGDFDIASINRSASGHSATHVNRIHDFKIKH
eukprot:scaffold505463_cov16-Prasinocladus_malaysianus.AAC.1